MRSALDICYTSTLSTEKSRGMIVLSASSTIPFSRRPDCIAITPTPVTISALTTDTKGLTMELEPMFPGLIPMWQQPPFLLQWMKTSCAVMVTRHPTSQQIRNKLHETRARWRGVLSRLTSATTSMRRALFPHHLQEEGDVLLMLMLRNGCDLDGCGDGAKQKDGNEDDDVDEHGRWMKRRVTYVLKSRYTQPVQQAQLKRNRQPSYKFKSKCMSFTT